MKRIVHKMGVVVTLASSTTIVLEIVLSAVLVAICQYRFNESCLEAVQFINSFGFYPIITAVLGIVLVFSNPIQDGIYQDMFYYTDIIDDYYKKFKRSAMYIAAIILISMVVTMILAPPILMRSGTYTPFDENIGKYIPIAIIILSIGSILAKKALAKKL